MQMAEVDDEVLVNTAGTSNESSRMSVHDAIERLADLMVRGD